jgi:transcriptional regulator with XRE-family HTH domain
MDVPEEYYRRSGFDGPRRTTGTARGLGELGEHLSTWRKLQRLPASIVAERAGISRDTLRALEQGRGSTSTENLLRVLRVLGIMERVIEAADPYATDIGRLRADEVLPQRVRSRTP